MTDPTSLPNFPPPADEHPLRGRVLDALKDLGIAPTIDDDGDVAFMVGEPPQQMFARCADEEIPTMRVFGQWQIGEAVPDDAELRLQRCNDFTLQLNVGKVGIVEGNLVVTVEHIVFPGEDVTKRLQVSVTLMLQVVQAWFGSFVEEEPESGEA